MSDTATAGIEREDLRLLRESATAFAQKHLNPGRLRRLRNEGREFDREIWTQFAELGWTGLMISEDAGGFGMGLEAAAAVLEPLGQQLMPEPLIAGALLPGDVLSRCPAGALRDRLLGDIASGKLIAALAWQSGLDPFAPGPATVTASKTSAGETLRGKALYVMPGRGADGYIVAAAKEGGQALYWIDASAKGLTVAARQRPDGGSVADLTFDVSLGTDACLASPDQGAAIVAASVDIAAILASAELLGAIRGAFGITIDYLKTRKQFDRTIGSFQALQHRAADLYLKQRVAAASLAGALRELEQAQSSEARMRAASRVKIRCSDVAYQVGREAIQLHGGIGYTDEHDIGLYMKRAIVLGAWLGNSAQHLRRLDRLNRQGNPVEARS